MHTISMSSEQLRSIDDRQNDAACEAVWGGGNGKYGASSSPSSRNDMQSLVNLLYRSLVFESTSSADDTVKTCRICPTWTHTHMHAQKLVNIIPSDCR